MRPRARSVCLSLPPSRGSRLGHQPQNLKTVESTVLTGLQRDTDSVRTENWYFKKKHSKVRGSTHATHTTPHTGEQTSNLSLSLVFAPRFPPSLLCCWMTRAVTCRSAAAAAAAAATPITAADSAAASDLLSAQILDNKIRVFFIKLHSASQQ